MAGKGPLNWTTEIAAQVTAQECVGMIAAHGARRVGLTFEGRQPTGIEFQIETRWGLRHYVLPVNVPATTAMLVKAAKDGRIVRAGGKSVASRTTPEHAANVAWRVMHDLLEVQIAVIEAGLADLERLMLAYQLVEPGKDMFDAVAEREAAALTAGS